MEGIVYCDYGGTCLIPSQEVSRLNKERCDVLTIPFFSHFLNGSKQGSSAWSIRRSESIPSSRRLPEKGDKEGPQIYSSSIPGDRRILQVLGRTGRRRPLIRCHMVGESAIRKSMNDEFEKSRKQWGSNSITSRLSTSIGKISSNEKRKHLKLDTNSLPFDPILKSDSAKAQGSSNIMNLSQSRHNRYNQSTYTKLGGNLLCALLIKVQAGLIGGNLPIHGGHPQDGKRRGCSFNFCLKTFACRQ